ncbi:MAG: C69 family dipeptidase [Acidobacteria bacterium]|nr:C69 family dipeptidase [Acidobacteriota bacterium]
MRRSSRLVALFIVVLAGAVGLTGAPGVLAQSGGAVSQQDELSGKKICGYPRPSGVPQEVWENACEACTSVPVSPEASAEGTLTSHSCDGGYEIRIKVVPGKKFAAGTLRDVMKGGGLGEEKPPNRQEIKVGQIPQAAETFTRYDASYPFMNEKGVIIGETTIGGRRELFNDEGLFDIMELERLALERGATAREVVKVMGEFGEKYGYGDSGECLTVADPKEVWQFEIFGAGAVEKGAVWAAKRIPAGEVGVSANRSRITTLGDDPNWTMYAKGVYQVAEAMGWWKKGDPFIFNRVFGMGAGPITPNRREWRVLSILAPSLKLDPWAPEQPFSVKPDKKVTVRDVMQIHRDVYEGTPFEQTSNPLAGPFGTPNRWTVPREYTAAPGYSPVERMIAVHQASYVVVLQARDNMPPWIGSLAWFAEDDAKTSVFTPLYAGNLKVPTAYEIGRRDRFDRNSAWWASNFINNWANLNWHAMIQDIRVKQVEIEDKLLADQAIIEKTALELYKADPERARTFISDYSNRVAQENYMKWWELADKLVTDYQDGGWRLSDPAKKSYPAEWLNKQGPFGTKKPDAPAAAAPVKKDEKK